MNLIKVIVANLLFYSCWIDFFTVISSRCVIWIVCEHILRDDWVRPLLISSMQFVGYIQPLLSVTISLLAHAGRIHFFWPLTLLRNAHIAQYVWSADEDIVVLLLHSLGELLELQYGVLNEFVGQRVLSHVQLVETVVKVDYGAEKRGQMILLIFLHFTSADLDKFAVLPQSFTCRICRKIDWRWALFHEELVLIVAITGYEHASTLELLRIQLYSSLFRLLSLNTRLQ